MSFTGLSYAVDIGQPVKVPLLATVAGTLTDPTVLTFAWDCTDSAGHSLVAETVWTYGVTGSIVRNSVGTFYAIVVPSIGGTWTVRFVGTGACQLAQNGTFLCSSSRLTPP